MEKSILTAKEAAVLLRISPATMYKLLQNDAVPNIQIGKRRVIPADRFMQWIEQVTKGGIPCEVQ